MRKVELLAELQRHDTALDRARERVARIDALQADRSALVAAEQEQAAAAAELHARQAELKDLELEVDDLRSRLQTLEKKLYGGSVMNPKELGAMTDDARQYRNQISPREDRILELYDIVEAASGALAETERKLEEARRAHAESQQALGGERAELTAVSEQHERERQALAGEADSQSLRTYESLRRTRGGVAVAEVTQRTCQGCRVSIPANLEQRARSGDELVLCQSCGRILHATR